ncbi:MAG: imidazoleglycerol-phosphate dehydratase HisB [Defluviitaleaceae bacterium]|nr:imidazoleglycerol-phosphate dehydratase HisB [Defluviitaleaceae bacterium]MCL2262628.1 imidazoleglycerol-phosphate dehydratase HisB [Defluviitaleaceae bacterium]
MRKSVFERRTKETYVNIDLNLDLADQSEIFTGIGFFDHMLEAMTFRAGFTMQIQCQGDLQVDAHHTIEDVGICIGQAIKTALDDKRGITRYASCAMPMDEALVNCAIDISGRGLLVFNAEIPTEMCGTFPTEMTEEFFRALAHNAGITLHINLAYGKNAHHIIEAIFKAVGLVLGTATRLNSDVTPSTKGVL